MQGLFFEEGKVVGGGWKRGRKINAVKTKCCPSFSCDKLFISSSSGK